MMSDTQRESDPSPFKHVDITDKIIRVFYEVYNELGFGYLESVYENALVIALGANGLAANQQVAIPVWFREHVVGKFEADLLVENKVILELKACRGIDESHRAQLLNYLRATEIEVGLLLNFGPRPEVKRLAFENRRKRIGSSAPISMMRVLLEK
jgi:GxxExxY protein